MMRYPKQPGQDADAHRRLAMVNLRLLDDVKRMKEAEKLLTEGFLGLTKMFNEQRAEVKRMKVALVVRDVKNDRIRAEGMEAAVAICRQWDDEWSLDCGCASHLADKIAAAKEQAGEADEANHQNDEFRRSRGK